MFDPQNSAQDSQARQRYDRAYETALPLYNAGRYAEELAAIDATGSDFGLWSSDVTHVRACLQALLGRPEEALATLRTGLAKGQWWREDLLSGDDDLATVAELDGFDELIREAQSRADAYNSSASAKAPIVRRPDETATGIFVALHGGDGRAERVAQMFAPATSRGYIVLAPWSSRHTTPARASWGWSDLDGTAADISHSLDALNEDERQLPVVAGGFSAGGRATLLWALRADPVPVRAVILVAPAIDPDLLTDDPPDRLPGLVVLGALDPWAERIRAAVKQLEPVGVRLDVVEGLGHQEPPDFADRLLAELDQLATG